MTEELPVKSVEVVEEEKSELAPLYENGRPKRQKAFLWALIESGGIIRKAAKATSISPQTHYNWLHSDPAYRKAYEVADKQAVDALVDEARYRGSRRNKPSDN